MDEYDPLKAPDPQEWLSLDEFERLFMIEDYHLRMNIQIEGLELHAAIHQIIENQLAENLPEAVEALERLQRQGLDRHEAIHAMGTVVLDFFWDYLREGKDFSESSVKKEYLKGLRKITKRSWYKKTRPRR